MNYTSALGRARLLAVSLIFISAAAAAVGFWRAGAGTRNASAEQKKSFHERLRSGVGSEVVLAARGADANAIRASVNSLNQFIFNRAGVRLGGQAIERLTDLEARAVAGEARRLMPQELSGIVSDALVNRISTLSDDEIAKAAEVLRGFDAPDLPDSFRRGRSKVKLRASKAGTVTPEEFVAQAQALRRADAASRQVFRGAIEHAVRAEIEGRVSYLGEAIPERFGTAATDGVTPLQAVLLVYSVAADDLMADSRAQLHERMRSVQEGAARTDGRAYPSPAGHHAFGPNGYIFSTPLDLAFGDESMRLLLDRIAERSARR